MQLLLYLKLPGDVLPFFWLWFMWVFKSHPHPASGGNRGGGCSGSPSRGWLSFAHLEAAQGLPHACEDCARSWATSSRCRFSLCWWGRTYCCSCSVSSAWLWRPLSSAGEFFHRRLERKWGCFLGIAWLHWKGLSFVLQANQAI